MGFKIACLKYCIIKKNKQNLFNEYIKFWFCVINRNMDTKE